MKNDTEPAPKGNPVVEIQKTIKERLLTQNDAVKESYINAEVQAKLTSRVELVKKTIGEIANAQKELQKIKPDTVLYDAAGKVAQEGYSKETVDKKTKLTERLEKLEKALTKSFDTADYGDLENLVK